MQYNIQDTHRLSASCDSVKQESIQTEEETLIKLQQERIQTCLVNQLGEVEGNKVFQIHLGNTRRSVRWRHYTPIPQIPVEFRKQDTNFCFDKPLENPLKKRRYYLSAFDLKEMEDGVDIDYKLEPLTINKFLDQSWIAKYKEKWIQKDGDLLIKNKKYVLDLHILEVRKPIVSRSITDNRIQNFSLAQAENLHNEEVSPCDERLFSPVINSDAKSTENNLVEESKKDQIKSIFYSIVERVYDVFIAIFSFFYSITQFFFTEQKENSLKKDKIEEQLLGKKIDIDVNTKKSKNDVDGTNGEDEVIDDQMLEDDDSFNAFIDSNK